LIEEIDYASCINIPSNSSGLINSLSHSSHDSKIKIIDNWEFRYFADEQPLRSISKKCATSNSAPTHIEEKREK
jgi:hypothetical protein